MTERSVVSTGIDGLDGILQGGWPQGRLYLVLGDPGAGKTTLGLQFLRDGAQRGETALYITLSETREEVTQVAASHGWTLDGTDLYELNAAEQVLGLGNEQTMFDPSDVEFRQTSRSILAEIERLKPARVVFDSLSELALLARDALNFRREVLLLKQALAENGCTALLLSDCTTPDADRQLQSLAHGVLVMEELSPEYGAERRRLRVRKLRGTKFRGGFHDYTIEKGGLQVFPRLVAAEHSQPFRRDQLGSGIDELDLLLGGGLARGSSTLLMGPAGTGKSTIAAQFALASLEADDPAALFLFDEGTDSFLNRARALNLNLDDHLQRSALTIQQIDPAQLSPGEFVQRIRDAVEQRGVRYVVIDSLNGYGYSMPDERFLPLQLHELLAYLNQMGVTTLLILAQHGTIGAMTSPADVTYVADSVILTRFFEADGKIRRAISMLKKRRGEHETAIREFHIDSTGLRVGAPLRGFQGVLTGVPTFIGNTDALLETPDAR